MANWRLKIDLSLPIIGSKEMDIEFTEFRDLMTSRLSKYVEQIYNIFGDVTKNKYEDLIEYLKYSKDISEWDEYMEVLYDFCDNYKIWIEQNWINFNVI